MAKGVELVKGTYHKGKVVVGVVRVIHGDYKDPAAYSQVKPGEILVLETTDPQSEKYMKMAAATVADSGGPNGHTMVQAVMNGLTAIVGTWQGRDVLKDGQIVVVDGTNGTVYEYIPNGEPAYQAPAGPPAAPPAQKMTLAEKMKQMAAKSGKTLDPEFLKKLEKRGD